MSFARRTNRNEITVSEFKAKCLRLVAEVGASGREIVLTKSGKAIARVVPLGRPERSTRGLWKGIVKIDGDIVHADWSAEFDSMHDRVK